MAARKLQTEIDRTLKKVAEGVELFESIYDKMQASTNATQKEKLEADLKTQIKKLQRLRDQIKTWLASNDIKDKSLLLENRRLIETQMEKFKACEKEMKTKAFSKEGLIQAAKMDPQQREKVETISWLQTKVEELQLQVETAEADIESLQGTVKKKSKTTPNTERLESLEHLNERRKWHISRLEIVLRLLDNGTLPIEKAIDLKEDVAYFVESNTDDEFEEDEGIYDELNLDEEEEKFKIGLNMDDDASDDSDEQSDDIPPRTPHKKHDEESVSSSRQAESPILKKASASIHPRKTSIAAETSKPSPPNFAQQPMSSVLKSGLPSTTPTKPVLPPIRYAAAAAAAVAPAKDSAATPSTSSHPPVTSTTAPSSASVLPTTSAPTPTAPSIAPSTSAASTSQDHLTTSPSLTHPSITSPMLSSAASVSQQQDDSIYSGQESPSLSEVVASPIAGPAATSSPVKSRKGTPSESQPSETPAAKPPSDSPAVPPQLITQDSTAASSPLPQSSQPISNAVPIQTPISQSPGPSAALAQPQYPPGVKALEQTQQAPNPRTPSAASRPVNPNAFPGSLSDLVISFENVKQKAAHRMSSLDQVHKMLESGYRSIPQPRDTEKPRYYVPRNPFQTPSYYPQTVHPVLNTNSVYAQAEVEVLFYVFYYLPGTYQQYLAAKELKRQSWRFHIKYLTWFQRHSEPQAITDEYEQGMYVYFDWEGSWCQRKKSDFRFEYRYLED